jgi:hypothetical protein
MISLIGVKKSKLSNGIDPMKSQKILDSWMTSKIGMSSKELLEKVGS